MEKVLRFWLDLGVDGFRADAVRHLFENDRFHDEPLNKEVKGVDPNIMYDAYEHTETGDQPGSYEMVRQWRKFLDKYAHENNRDYIVLITEVDMIKNKI
jgi:alpha-glucosidase